MAIILVGDLGNRGLQNAQPRARPDIDASGDAFERSPLKKQRGIACQGHGRTDRAKTMGLPPTPVLGALKMMLNTQAGERSE